MASATASTPREVADALLHRSTVEQARERIGLGLQLRLGHRP